MPARRRTLRALQNPARPATAATAPARLRVGVIGAGRVGAVLGAALAAAGHDVVAAAGLSAASAERAARLLPGTPLRHADEVAAASDLVVLAVPDDTLPGLVAGLAETGAHGPPPRPCPRPRRARRWARRAAPLPPPRSPRPRRPRPGAARGRAPARAAPRHDLHRRPRGRRPARRRPVRRHQPARAPRG